jgi:uncharacterized protein (TIGR02594 family)
VTEFPWISIARSHIGLREIPGAKHHPTIVRWLGQLGGWWADDETPWCGTFVAACLVEAGCPKPRHWYRARAYEGYGHYLDRPAYGSIVILERGGGGHVGFLVAQTTTGRPLILGGNQGNAVSIAPFEPWRILGYRWPPGPYHPTIPLPTVTMQGPVSRDEQ